jgi:hypothetical protein
MPAMRNPDIRQRYWGALMAAGLPEQSGSTDRPFIGRFSEIASFEQACS